MNENNIKTKAFRFALEIIQMYKTLVNIQREYILSKQLLRAGTSVGAMLHEAEHAESPADFRHKLSIAQKEINETLYWLELLNASNYLEKETFENTHQHATEILKILTRSLKTLKSKIPRNI